MEKEMNFEDFPKEHIGFGSYGLTNNPTDRDIANKMINESMDPSIKITPSLRLKLDSWELKIEKALSQVRQDEREKTIKECAERIQTFIDRLYTSDTKTESENIQIVILSILKESKS